MVAEKYSDKTRVPREQAMLYRQSLVCSYYCSVFMGHSPLKVKYLSNHLSKLHDLLGTFNLKNDIKVSFNVSYVSLAYFALLLIQSHMKRIRQSKPKPVPIDLICFLFCLCACGFSI